MSALLCLSMMLAACSNEVTDGETETDTSTETGTEVETEKEVPVDEVVDYSAILGEWSKYLTPVGIKEEAAYDSATYLFQESDSDTLTYNVQASGSLAMVEKVRKAQYDDEGRLTSPIHRANDFYNLKTGEKILSFSNKGYDSELQQYASIFTGEVYFGAIAEVVSRQWTNLGDEETPDWQYVRTYSYYDNTGKELAKDLEDQAAVSTEIGVYALQIGDKAYHCMDGEIILVTHANDMYPIPDFDIEYKGYRYSFESSREYRIQVLNEKYELVADYLIPDYFDEYTTHILENGDVYIFGIEACSDNDEDYDLIQNEEKYRVSHVILSVTTGEAKVVDAPFILKNGEIFTNFNADSTGIKLNGEYQYAEIIRIEDRELANDVEFVILDNTLTEVAALPAIFENQTGLDMGLADGRFLVNVESVWEDSASYIVDAKTGEFQRYIPTSSHNVNGGFIADGKLYNDKLEMIYDLKDVESYMVYMGAILFTITETEEPAETEEGDEEPDDPEEITVSYVGYIDESGEFQKTELGSDVDVDYIGYQLYVVETEDSMYLCNRLGERLTLRDTDTIVSVDVIASSDGVVVVRAINENTSSEDYEVEYNYYIIK